MGDSVVSDGADRGRADPSRPERPRPGLYRHYKGADYRVLDCVRHSESGEWLVLYRALYGERGLWVRPLAMFVGTVDKGRETVARFALVRGDDGRTDDGIERAAGDG